MPVDNVVDIVVDENDEMDTNQQYVEDVVVSDDETTDHTVTESFEECSDIANKVDDVIPGSEKVVDNSDDGVVEEKVTNWEDDGDHSKFIEYILKKKNSVPKHSGDTVWGCERAKAYLKNLLNEISKAIRTDLDGKIDEASIENVSKQLQNDIDRLDDQIMKLKGKSKKAHLKVNLIEKGMCDKCGCNVPMWNDIENNRMVCVSCDNTLDATGFEKKASTPVINVFVTPFERAIVGILINSAVSAGHNIEEVYEKLKNKYNFEPREELAITQLVADYGYPIFKDRGLLNENSDPSSGNGMDWMSNYYA